MNKIWIIIQREYITRVRKRSFIITTLLAPIGFFLLMSSSVLISTYSQGKTDVAVIDDSRLFKEVPIPDAEDQSVYFHKITENFDSVKSHLADKNGRYEAVIYIPANYNINRPDNPVISGIYSVRPGLMKRQFINQRMTEAVNKVRLKMLNISEETQDVMQSKVEVHFSSLGNDKENKGYMEVAAIVGFIMGFAIYIVLIVYGTLIMRGVMEEKTNRIVEVLTSSVKPFQLLMGKIVGVGAVGLTQFILWMLLTAATYIFVLPVLGISVPHGHPYAAQANAPDIDPDTISGIVSNIHQLPLVEMGILFPFFFLGGFLLYGSLFAAIGAAMGEDGDQQSLVFPVTVPIIISFFIAMNVINNPDSKLGFWGSLIPFTSPVVMSAMLPFRPPWWQVALSMILLVAGFIFTTWIAARIYRVGILMYGKKIRLKEMGRWILAKN